MTELRFTWDDAKDSSNRRKHGIGFEEAIRVFADPLHLSRQDRVEGGEMRWQTIGSVGGTTLCSWPTVHEDDENGRPVEVIRIISARAATRRERRRYEDES